MKQELFEQDDKIILANTVDIEPVLRANQAEFNAHSQKASVSSTGSKGGLRKVASIPMDTIMALGEKGVGMMNGDQAALRRFLNSNPQFRTSRGKL